MQYLLCTVTVLALFVQYAGSTTCIQCNSAEKPACKENDPEALKQFAKVCEPLKEGTFAGENAKGCRKILQTVEGAEEQTIRECAYSGTDVDGQKKSGNWAIHVFYYQCTNDKTDTPCNSAPVTTFFAVIALALCLLL